jgi:hypothetical protein
VPSDAKSREAAAESTPAYEPRTPLGRRLWELREQILAEGEPTLDWDDLERELASRRGHRTADD